MKNPFDKYEADEYSVEEIYNLYVDNDDMINKFSTNRHQFIWGSRGSGKSMLLRYFEPYCQLKSCEDWNHFCETSDGFIGIYCPIPRGLFINSSPQVAKSKLDDYTFEMLSIHLFIMLITERIIITYIRQLRTYFNDLSRELVFTGKILELFDLNKKEGSNLDDLLEYITREKKIIIKYFKLHKIKKIEYTGNITGYHDFLLPFLEEFKIMLAYEKSISLMFDDVGFLPSFMHNEVNTWISNRHHKVVNIKVASVNRTYSSFMTNDGMIIRNTDDYDEIFLDRGETKGRSFNGSAKMIADKRLQYSKIGNKSISKLLPANDVQNDLKKEAKEVVMNRTSDVSDKNRYVNRNYLKVFYQLLSEKNLNRDYSGFDNIAYLSQNNIRKFLKLSYTIIDESIREDGEKKLIHADYSVPTSLQNKSIIDFSEREYNEIKIYKPGEMISELEKLQTMLNSMCSLFSYRLKDSSRVVTEAGITSFAIKDEQGLDDSFMYILTIATKYGYLLRTNYRDKKGLKRTSVYTMSKFLLPKYYLDPSPIAGRLTISCALFKLACENTDSFIAEVKNLDSFDLNDQLTLKEYLEEDD
ncbi:MAG: hypothetical protein CVU95_04030 [Firmicutes bacterium HGW-Firmicutes-2]|jgi:hypothetical protein|nr:MAG: hypothetical protein CVU95_04030 [Firmicutes bacterium HGW-Firmicutes-2]